MKKKDILLSVVRAVFLSPVYLYRLVISPLKPASCLYTPTCSQYFIGCVKKLGIFKGAVLGFMRIGRCTGAFFLGGPDPVPESFSLKEARSLYTVFRKKRPNGPGR